MSLKVFLFLAPVALGGYYFASGSGGSFTRDVDRTPAQVAAAIADLDIRRQPGTPGTDPATSGGVRPVFRTERTADTVTFTVWSGDKVATRMIAHLEPLDGGRRTRIRAEVVRGDAPDAQVSPAFRSTGTTLGLFGNALNDEVNTLLAPRRRSREECNQLERQLLEGGPGDAPATGLEAIRRVNGAYRELQRQGCDPGNNGPANFETPRAAMGDAPTLTATDGPPPGTPRFEPGRPMVDVGRGDRRR